MKEEVMEADLEVGMAAVIQVEGMVADSVVEGK